MTSNATNPRTCKICNHPDRQEIEMNILAISPSNPSLTLDVIANAYDVSISDLKVHALMHTPLSMNFSQESEGALADCMRAKCEDTHASSDADATSHQPPTSSPSGSATLVVNNNSLSGNLMLRESDLLLASANEMMVTMSMLGKRIKSYASDNSAEGDQRLLAMCSTPIVNLYVNSSAEIRKNVQAIAALDAQINGTKDSANSGLSDLTKAILASSKALEHTTQDSNE